MILISLLLRNVFQGSEEMVHSDGRIMLKG